MAMEDIDRLLGDQDSCDFKDTEEEIAPTICEHGDCTELAADSVEYCEEHYEWHYCECGQELGEYAGEGMCKRCQ